MGNFCNAGEDWEIILLLRWRLTHDIAKFHETICMSVDEFFLRQDLVLFFNRKKDLCIDLVVKVA